MKTRYKINEMTCSGCQAKVTEALQSVVEHVEVHLQPAEAIIETHKKIALDQLQHALSHKGPYTIQEITINTDGTEMLSEIAHHAIHSSDKHNQTPENLQHIISHRIVHMRENIIVQCFVKVIKCTIAMWGALFVEWIW